MKILPLTRQLFAPLIFVLLTGMVACSGAVADEPPTPTNPVTPTQAMESPSPLPSATAAPSPEPTPSPAATAEPAATRAPAAPIEATDPPPESLAATPAPPGSPDAVEQKFVQFAIPLAQAEQAETGVPASVSVAMAALESGWGRSDLATQYNNYHGISCSEPNQGLPCVPWGDGSWNQYRTPEDGFVWQGKWLRAHEYFDAAFQHTDNPEAFAREVLRCYISCARPFPQRYYERVIEIIDKHDLRQYDASQNQTG